MKKVINILFLLALSAVVLGVLGLTYLGRNNVSNSYENRSLEALPEISRDTLLDGSLVSRFDGWATDHLKGRDYIMKALTGLKLKVLHLPVVSNVVVTDDRLLGYNSYERWDTAYLSERAAEVAGEIGTLSAQVAEYGGTLYYVGVPEQYSYFSSRYPSYLENRAWLLDASWNMMENAFRDAGVRFINMRAHYASLGSPDTFYSATDHHYSFYGALELAGHLLTTINEEHGCALWVPSAENMDILELENKYMGSRGRKLYGMADYGERAAIGFPKEPVAFVRYNNGKQVEPTVYTLPASAEETIAYTLYMGNDFGETVIQTNRPELPSVLIVGESFTNAVESIVYTAFDEMRSVDLRYYQDMTLDEYIDSYRPDYVIIIRDDTAFLNPLA